MVNYLHFSELHKKVFNRMDVSASSESGAITDWSSCLPRHELQHTFFDQPWEYDVNIFTYKHPYFYKLGFYLL